MMEVIIFVIIVIAAFWAIASGIWVAIALVSAISARQGRQDSQDRSQSTGCLTAKAEDRGQKNLISEF
ncbi:MAG: hypothetical protein ACE5NM_04200 [Sedimentisphaerales bacterium]